MWNLKTCNGDGLSGCDTNIGKFKTDADTEWGLEMDCLIKSCLNYQVHNKKSVSFACRAGPPLCAVTLLLKETRYFSVATENQHFSYLR